jgi:hypothetical protein
VRRGTISVALGLAGPVDGSRGAAITSQGGVREAKVTTTKISLLATVYCEVASGSARNTEELTVLAMVAEKFGHQQLDLLPVGVSLVLRHVSPLSILCFDMVQLNFS